MTESDGDTSTIRKALTEKTSVVIPLGVVIAGLLTMAGMAGAWGLWVTNSLQELKQDMASVKAAVGVVGGGKSDALTTR